MVTDCSQAFPPVRLVTFGVFRGGSTWAFNVARRLLALAPPPRPVAHLFAEPDELDERLWAPRVETHEVIKCHQESERFLEALDCGRAGGVVVSMRDPMACLASVLAQFCQAEPFSEYWTFERALAHIEEGLQLAAKLHGRSDAVFLDLHREGEELSLLRIAAFLGINPGVDALRAIHAEFTFETMRARSERIAEMPAQERFRGINDPDTLMHPGHVEKGARRDWRAELTAEQISDGLERFAPYAHVAPIGAPGGHPATGAAAA